MDNEITTEVKKLESFVAPESKAAGLKLRPFTAASLILLRKTDNGFITNAKGNLEMDVAAFLYLHATPIKNVIEASATMESWRAAVLEFAERVTVRDFVDAAKEIRGIIDAAFVGQDYEVPTENHDPN